MSVLVDVISSRLNSTGLHLECICKKGYLKLGEKLEWKGAVFEVIEVFCSDPDKIVYTVTLEDEHTKGLDPIYEIECWLYRTLRLVED